MNRPSEEPDSDELGPVAKMLLERLRVSGNADLLADDDDEVTFNDVQPTVQKPLDLSKGPKRELGRQAVSRGGQGTVAALVVICLIVSYIGYIAIHSRDDETSKAESYAVDYWTRQLAASPAQLVSISCKAGSTRSRTTGYGDEDTVNVTCKILGRDGIPILKSAFVEFVNGEVTNLRRE